MSDPNGSSSSRREFLTGGAIRKQAERAGDEMADAAVQAEELTQARAIPVGGDTIRLTTRAMACEFAVVMNPHQQNQIEHASRALEIIHDCEGQMSVYRDDSEMSLVNREAAKRAYPVEPTLFSVLARAKRIAGETGGAFDPTSGPLIALWRRCRNEFRTPTEDEIADCLQSVGVSQIELDEADCSVRLRNEFVEINLGGIGKGDALDRAARFLDERGVGDYLFHGGHSSLLARGDHNAAGGWPVGIRNPLFPDESFATLLLKDAAMSTSGTGVQHFRLEGKRYGHILDPRTGRPADGMLSVTVVAPTAAEADALSTAFFVLGVENARRYCDNRKEIGAVLLPQPARGRRLDPVVCNFGDDVLFLSESPPG